MKKWECRAIEVSEVYGTFVDWNERFFTCPECGEPIYEEDYEDALGDIFCPICEEPLFDFTL